MSETTLAAGRSSTPAAFLSLRTLYRLLLRMQLTWLRALGLAALGAVAVLLALLTRQDDDPLHATAQLLAEYGLTLAIPVCVLWLATASVGDLVDDRLLVYLWLKPVARWQLPAAAVLATATVVVPLIVVPLVIATLVAGTPELALPAAVACLLASLAYAALFVAAGLWLRRAFWWGLLYVLLWENGLARASDGAARLSVGGYARSVLARLADVELGLGERGLAPSLAALALIAAGGALAATIRYRRAEVD
jgi:ABC-2 type transport system permease protein